MSDKQATATVNFDGTWFLILFFLLFFWRGCGEPEASPFDEYLRAAHGRQVEGVQYDPLVSGE